MSGSSKDGKRKDEKEPLLLHSQQDGRLQFEVNGLGKKIKATSTSQYGGTDDQDTPKYSKRKEKPGSGQDAKKIPISKLFRYATFRDKVIIFIGTLAAFIHGAGMPFLALIFGSMTNTFIQQSIIGFANSTTSTSRPSTSSSILPSGVRIDRNATATGNGSDSDHASPLVFDPLTRDEFAEFVVEYSLYYVYIGIIVFFASLIQAVCWEWSCERQTYRLRQEFFYQVIRQEISWFDTHQTGDLSIKLSDDLERVREGIGHKFSMVIQYVCTFLAGFGVGFITSWQLTLVILSLTPLLAGTSAFTGRMIATQSAREQQKYGKAGAVAEEVLSCIRTVTSFGGEVQEIQRYESALAEGRNLAIKKYHILSCGVALVFFVLYSSYALAFWYGCDLLDQGRLTPGDIFTVFFSVLVGAFSLGNAVPFISIIAIAQGSGAVVFEVIDSEPVIDPYSKEGYIPDKIEGRIKFKNVDFNYPSRPTLQILKNFDLDIEPGKTVAIVGPSGAGKSTIVSLILRFYDPVKGSVLLDGYDIRLLNLAWLRHHIGVVSQEPVLFGTTIYENIRYGREDVTPDEIVAAARMANAHDFVSSLPQGYDTMVGERGAQLSGGQKQRIAIARALVRDPRILLLDEATSALDAKSEAVVQSALDRARKGRTTIIIAHRLSTVKDADCIYALKDGMIAEAGTHAQLMAKEGLYYDLVTAQTTMDPEQEFSGNDASGSQESHDSSSGHSPSFGIADPTKFGIKQKRTRRRKGGPAPVKRNALPDPDRARLIREAQELNAKYPGIWKVLKVNRPEWFLLTMGGIGCVITGAITPVFAYFYAEMFATFEKTGEELREAAFFWSMMFLVLAVVSAFGFWLRTICVASAGEYLTMRLRLLSYTGVMRQSISWFDKESNSPSRLATRLARDAPIVKAAAGHRMSLVVASLVTIISALGIAFYFGWQLALAILAGFPILVIAGYIQIQVGKSGQKKDAVLMEEAGRTANEAIANIRTVQSLCQERIFFEKYLEHLLPVYVEAHKQGIIYGLAFSFSEAAIFMIYAAAFRYGGYLIEVGVMEPTSVFRVFFEIAFCAVAVGQMTSFVPDYTKANLASALIFNLIETQSKIDPFNPHGVKPDIDGRITFTDVIFRYPSRPDMAVLQGLTFDVQPGQTLALVGPSGCGKSTVVGIIERFYDVLDGRVMVDGFDVRSINVKHLRSHIGLVTQEPVLFDCTIRENIAYGYAKGPQFVTDDMIVEAATAANIHNFICGLPQRYDTFVGERGTQLSGGQKQRIAIARALVRDPKILLLDEATSALDTESEKVVQEALDKARAGRTCIIIAHRLSTIQNADLIAVVHKGKIHEIGTHEQLRARKGMYFKLTRKQQITH